MPQPFLKELDLIFQAVYSLHPLGAVMYGNDHKVVHVNSMAVSLYGQNVPAGSDLESCVMAAGRRQPDLFEKALKGEPVTLEPYELVPPSGFMHEEEEPRWIKEMYNPIFHPESGQLMGTVALLEDCSHEVEIANSLTRAQTLIEEMGNLAPMVVLMIDQQQLIQYANCLTATLSGFNFGELQNGNFIHLLLPEEYQMDMARWLLDLQTGEASEYLDLPLASRCGEKRMMRWRMRKVAGISSDLMLILLMGQYAGQAVLAH